MSATYRETALNFGPSGGLVGILNRPGQTGGPAPGLALVFLNSGVIHRIGPNRLHVRLARRIAALGVPSLRLDLPGIGDSRVLGMSTSMVEENQGAIRAALDLLQEEKGIADRFVLFGLCSGAGDAFQAACLDPRIVGMCLIDPIVLFPTWKSVAFRVLRWSARPRSWYRLVTGRYAILRHVRERLGAPARERVPEEAPRGPAPLTLAERKRRVAEALSALVARGVRICYIVTGDQRHVYNYRTQFLDSFPGIGLETVMQLELFPTAAHTFPHEASRAELERTLVAWISETDFPAPAVSRSGLQHAG